MKIYSFNRLYRFWSVITIFGLFFLWGLIPGHLQAGSEKTLTEPTAQQLKTILNGFEGYVQKAMKDWQVPGLAVAIVRGDEIIYAKGFGQRKIGAPEPVTTETLFQIGSTSKAFTATLVGLLVDEKKINWEDRVVDHLPDFRMYDPWVTREFMIVDLLAHRAGLPGNGGDTILVIGYDRPFAKKALGLIKPVTSFRSTYAYSNLLYLFPEDLMKKYWGKTWEEGLRERLLAPLGMSASSADLASFRTAANAAHQHTRRPNGEVASIPMDHPSLSFAYTAGPAGGINSNVLDMAKWLRFNLNQGVGGGRQLVSQESLAYIHSPKTIIAPGLSYAQGWLYQEGGPVLAIWHNGDTGGHHSVVAFVPQARVGIVVLSNLGGDNSLPEALMSRFLSQYLGRPEKDYSAEMLAARRKAKEEEKAKAIKKPDLPSPPLPMKAYAGRYGNDICGQIKVGEKDGRLSLKVGLSDEDLILRPWDRDTFEAFIPPFNDEMGLVSFSLTGGLVTSVKIEEFAKDVCGEFVRIE